MSRSIHAVIAPGHQSTRVMVTEVPGRTLLTAHLAPSTTHPRALPYLLEALAGALGGCDGPRCARCGRVGRFLRDHSLPRRVRGDVFADCGTPPLYSLEWIPLARARRKPAAFHDAMRSADFRDLRHVLLGGSGR